MTIDSLSLLITAAGVPIAALVFWWQRREAMLRKSEVLAWSNEVISALSSLWIICRLRTSAWETPEVTVRMNNILFDTSILIERGRLFFKNADKENYGLENEPAHQGYRPRILDPIMTAHRIACLWGESNEQRRLRMAVITEKSLQQFVSLAQKEVGRGKLVGSPEAAAGGKPISIDELLMSVDDSMLEKIHRIS